MTRRLNGSPDRVVNELDTFGGGGSGVGSNVIVDNPQDIASTNLLLILADLGNILTKLQGAITVNLGETGDLATETTLDEFRDSFLLEDFATEFTLDSGLGAYVDPIIGSHDLATQITLEPVSGPLPVGGRWFVRRLWIKAAYNLPDDVGVEFIVRLGSLVIAHDDLIKSQPYVDSIGKLGDVDAPLTLELLQARKVFYNIAARVV